MLAAIWDAHREHLETLEIYDADTGRTYSIDARTFEAHAFRRELGQGEQIIIATKHMSAPRQAGQPANGPEDAAPLVQLMLTTSTATPGTYFEPAREPRPRTHRPQRRHLFGRP